MDRHLLHQELSRSSGVHQDSSTDEPDHLAHIQRNDQFIHPRRQKGPNARRVQIAAKYAGANTVQNMGFLWTEIANGDLVQ